ncbi:hypothetical protein QJQ45_010807 [Haematococcus lacustris]|nr:hypothetical protein QJQ45_010807 [Haematococcus lacustris]
MTEVAYGGEGGTPGLQPCRPSLDMVSNTSKLASQEAVKWKHVISGMQARALDAINKGVPQEDARHRQLQEVKKMLTDRTKRIDELVKQKKAELEEHVK